MNSFERTYTHLRSRWIRAGMAMAALAIAAGSCSSDDGAGGGAPDATGGTEELTASATGVTADSIKLGVVLIDFAGLLEFGLDLEPGPINEQWMAWAAAQNAAGGVHGRELELVIEEFLPVGNETALAACASLTEDHEVFLAMGQLFGDSPLCYTESHDTAYISLFGTGAELEERSNAPLLGVGMSGDRALLHATEIFIDEGIGEGKRVAVQYPAIARDAVESTLLPRLEDAGIDVVVTSVAEDFGADGQAATDAASIEIQRMRDADVDVLLTTSGAIGIVGALQSNDFSPQVVFFSGDASNGDLADATDIDPAFLEDAIAITPNNPSHDELLADELVEECVDIYNDSAPEEPLVLDEMTTGELRSTAQGCAGFRLFVALAVAAGPDLTYASLLAAAESLGSIDLPGLRGASLGPDQHSGGNEMRIYAYDPDAGDLRPQGDPILVTG